MLFESKILRKNINPNKTTDNQALKLYFQQISQTLKRYFQQISQDLI